MPVKPLTVSAILAATLVAGMALYEVSARANNNRGSQQGNPQRVSTGLAEPAQQSGKTFFADLPAPRVELTLHPDPFVQQSLSGFPPSTENVNVFLPLYPGAVKAPEDKAIGDMGTPMTSALLDGALYWSSPDSERQIENWFKATFGKLGYSESGQGSSASHGQTISTDISFTKSGQPAGNPTAWPQIDLGLARGDHTTTFKLKVDYIALPARSSDSKLPSDIVKVMLSGGGKSFAVTDSGWIAKVVRQINNLKVDPPSARSCPSYGTLAGQQAPYSGPVQAKFIEQNRTSIPVQFTMPCGVRDVIVGNTKTALAGTGTLDKEINDVTGFNG